MNIYIWWYKEFTYLALAENEGQARQLVIDKYAGENQWGHGHDAALHEAVVAFAGKPHVYDYPVALTIIDD